MDERLKKWIEESKESTRQSRVDGLTSVLRGKVLRRADNHYEGGYSGGSSYYETSHALFLYEDGTFRYHQKTVTSISAGGMSLPSERADSHSGTWGVQFVKDEPALVLRNADRSVLTWWHTRTGSGIQYLDGKPWTRKLIG